MSTIDSGSGSSSDSSSGSGSGSRSGSGRFGGFDDPRGGRRRRKRLYGSVRLAEPLPAGDPTGRQPREVPPPLPHPGLALQVLNLRALRHPPG